MLFIRSTENSDNTRFLQVLLSALYQRWQKSLHNSKLYVGSSMKKFVKELLSTDYSLQRKTKPFPLYINIEERKMCKKNLNKKIAFYRESCSDPTLDKAGRRSGKMTVITMKRGWHQIPCTSSLLATSQNTQEDI